VQPARLVGEQPGPHAPAIVADEIDEAHAVLDLRAGGDGRVHQGAIEHGPARRVQAVHPVARLHRDGQRVVAVDERGAPHHRRARGLDRRQHTPAGQLKHAAAHERESGQRVAAVPAAVHHEHAEARASQQQRGRSARAPRAGHDRVVARCERRRCEHGYGAPVPVASAASP
jgi:hypothetical protein